MLNLLPEQKSLLPLLLSPSLFFFLLSFFYQTAFLSFNPLTFLVSLSPLSRLSETMISTSCSLSLTFLSFFLSFFSPFYFSFLFLSCLNLSMGKEIKAIWETFSFVFHFLASFLSLFLLSLLSHLPLSLSLAFFPTPSLWFKTGNRLFPHRYLLPLKKRLPYHKSQRSVNTASRCKNFFFHFSSITLFTTSRVKVTTKIHLSLSLSSYSFPFLVTFFSLSLLLLFFSKRFEKSILMDLMSWRIGIFPSPSLLGLLSLSLYPWSTLSLSLTQSWESQTTISFLSWRKEEIVSSFLGKKYEIFINLHTLQMNVPCFVLRWERRTERKIQNFS